MSSVPAWVNNAAHRRIEVRLESIEDKLDALSEAVRQMASDGIRLVIEQGTPDASDEDETDETDETSQVYEGGGTADDPIILG